MPKLHEIAQFYSKDFGSLGGKAKHAHLEVKRSMLKSNETIHNYTLFQDISLSIQNGLCFNDIAVAPQ